MTNHFPGHHPHPGSVDTLNGIEDVALAIQQLRDAMTATSETPPVAGRVDDDR